MKPEKEIVTGEELKKIARGVNDKIIPITPRGKFMRPRTIWKAFRQGRLEVDRSLSGLPLVNLIPQPNRYRVQDNETGKWHEIHLRPDQKVFYPITEEAFLILSSAPQKQVDGQVESDDDDE